MFAHFNWDKDFETLFPALSAPSFVHLLDIYYLFFSILIISYSCVNSTVFLRLYEGIVFLPKQSPKSRSLGLFEKGVTHIIEKIIRLSFSYL